MPAEAIAIICLCIIAYVGYSCIRINAPRTKEEEHAKFIQDCKEFDAYMENKKH